MGQKREREPELVSEPADLKSDLLKAAGASAAADANPVMVIKKKQVNRCFGCRRKVGLIGFRCRCGDLFCSEHRYTDRHECRYDYKASGRAAIARENPVVRPAKLLKV